MARIRTIKPEFWKHEDLSELAPEAHMLAAALLNYADDEGYFNANPKLIKAECCPLRDDSMSIPGMIQELSNIGYIRTGKGNDGKRYGKVVNFSEHQTISHKKESKIKHLVTFQEDSSNATGTLHPEQGTGNREQGTGNTTAAVRPSPKKTDPQFDEFKSKYPKRAGSQPWPRAEKAIRARLREGHTWEEILAGVDRYAAFCHATDKIGTETVMQAATFCGPDKRFLEPFDLPREQTHGENSRRDRPQSAAGRNREASRRFLERQQRV